MTMVMRLIASMHLFNEATSAVMTTGTHVDHFALLLLTKMMLFSFFLKHCLWTTFIKKKLRTPTIREIFF